MAQFNIPDESAPLLRLITENAEMEKAEISDAMATAIESTECLQEADGYMHVLAVLTRYNKIINLLSQHGVWN